MIRWRCWSVVSVSNCQTDRSFQSSTFNFKSSKLISFRTMGTRASHRSGLEMLSHLKMINNEFLLVTDAIFKAAMTAGSPTVTTSMTTMISVMLVMMKMWWMMNILFISMHSFPRFIQTVSFLLLHICNICTARARASHVLYCCFVTHLLSINNKQAFLQTELFLTNWLYGWKISFSIQP